eukprot:UN12554
MSYSKLEKIFLCYFIKESCIILVLQTQKMKENVLHLGTYPKIRLSPTINRSEMYHLNFFNFHRIIMIPNEIFIYIN